MDNYSKLIALGIDLPSGATGENRVRCHQAVCQQHKGTEKTLGANVDTGVYHCFRCDWKGCASGSNSEPYDPAGQALKDKERKQQVARDGEAARKRLNRIKAGLLPASHPDALPLRRYLALRLNHELSPVPADIQYHPGLDYWQDAQKVGAYPAMVSTIRTVTGKEISLHVTYLAPDGSGKAPVNPTRKNMPPEVRGSLRGTAIQLCSAGPVLGVAEGIETALALATSRPEPWWSVRDAGGLESVQIPLGTDTVLIGADNDENGRDQIAAEKLKQRLISEGHRVFVLLAPTPGTYWADRLTEGR